MKLRGQSERHYILKDWETKKCSIFEGSQSVPALPELSTLKKKAKLSL
jgi:hypothetical protein